MSYLSSWTKHCASPDTTKKAVAFIWLFTIYFTFFAATLLFKSLSNIFLWFCDLAVFFVFLFFFLFFSKIALLSPFPPTYFLFLCYKQSRAHISFRMHCYPALLSCIVVLFPIAFTFNVLFVCYFDWSYWSKESYCLRCTIFMQLKWSNTHIRMQMDVCACSKGDKWATRPHMHSHKHYTCTPLTHVVTHLLSITWHAHSDVIYGRVNAFPQKCISQWSRGQLAVATAFPISSHASHICKRKLPVKFVGLWLFGCIPLPNLPH